MKEDRRKINCSSCGEHHSHGVVVIILGRETKAPSAPWKELRFLFQAFLQPLLWSHHFFLLLAQPIFHPYLLLVSPSSLSYTDCRAVSPFMLTFLEVRPTPSLPATGQTFTPRTGKQVRESMGTKDRSVAIHWICPYRFTVVVHSDTCLAESEQPRKIQTSTSKEEMTEYLF